VPGIGKAIAQRLARQGLSVVLVALGDSLLDSTFEELQTAYPKVQFRKVCSGRKMQIAVAVNLLAPLARIGCC
jgi:NAD(P)-dependent dehydrogenase (short-subunit alcohol dehydrogenase family)